MSTSKRSDARQREPRGRASRRSIDAGRVAASGSASKRARRRCRAPIPERVETSRRRSTASRHAIKWGNCSRSSPSIRPTGRRRRGSHESYRDATAADASALDRIFRHQLLRHLRASLPSGRPRRLPRPVQASKPGRSSSTIPPIAFRVAEVDGETVGFVKLGPSSFRSNADARHRSSSTSSMS